MMDYHCGKFDCSFSCFGSIVRSERHADADERFTQYSGVSNNRWWVPRRPTYVPVLLQLNSNSQPYRSISHSSNSSPLRGVPRPLQLGRRL